MYDPERVRVFHDILTLLDSNRYASDVILCRAPPCDRLLKSVLRGALAAVHLTIREGFEIKVTEAITKGRKRLSKGIICLGIPVIAYRTGGIPIKVQDGVTGFLCECGDVKGVAEKIREITLQDENCVRARLSKNGLDQESSRFFSVVQAVNWLYLVNCVADGNFEKAVAKSRDAGNGIEINQGGPHCGKRPFVQDLWETEYSEV